MNMQLHVTASIERSHFQEEADRTAARIYAKEELALDDYAMLTTVGKRYPQEIEAEREQNPARREILLSEARRLRLEAKQHIVAKKLAREQAEFDRREAFVPPERIVGSPELRDEMFAILHDEDASEKEKLEARRTLRANNLAWPEQELLALGCPYRANELRPIIEGFARQLA